MKANHPIFKMLVASFFVLSSQLHATHSALTQLIDRFSQKMETQNKLNLTTSLELGGKKIEEVSLFYSSNNPLELNEAKALIAEMTQMFLEELNGNAFLKPELNPYPFTPNQIDITIFFRGANGKYAVMPKIAQISLEEGVVTFYKYENKQFEVIYKENIEKAMKLN